MEQWVQTHGTPELKRALKEGYSVQSGVANLIVSSIGEHLNLITHVQSDWLDVGERSSPRGDSFASRDAVLDLSLAMDLPDGWRVDVSRISRFTLLDGSYFTGVMLDVYDEDRKHLVRGSVNFEAPQ